MYIYSLLNREHSVLNLLSAEAIRRIRPSLNDVLHILYLAYFQCVPAALQGANTPIYPGVRLGNGLDDDCDGAIDEEIPNGIGKV